MMSRPSPTHAVATVLLLAMAATLAIAADSPTTEDQMNALTAMCESSAQARTDRQASASLYDRLGGYDRILDLTHEIVRRHQKNDGIKKMFEHVDADHLARLSADFIAAGTGGTAAYTGRSLPSSHAQLHLTDADFLSAGGDIVGAMQEKGYGQQEIDEMVCILMSLKDQVVSE